MADATLLGLVSDVLRSLASTTFQEIGRLRSLNDDISALKDTYSQIQSVLNDAQAKQKEQKGVETWLKSLRSASLEVENILDEVITDAMLQRLHKVRGLKYQVRAFLSSNHNPLMVRTRVANKVNIIRKKLDRIAANRSQFNFISNAVSVDAGVRGETISTETTSLVPMFEIYGRDDEVKTVVEKICSKDIIGDGIEGFHVYAIWGMGGMGKTTLAQLIYNHERVKAHFELQSWVYVSNEFQVKKLTRGIIESINNTQCGLSELDAMQADLQNKLEGKRFLIVLDDVWIEERTKWDELSKALNCGAEGSIVMVTTRNHTTSKMMAKVPKFQHQLGCLSDDDSWLLFKKLAFASGSGIREGESTWELESIGKEIVKKCKGLPLAVKTLGGLMWSKSSVSAWQSVKNSDVWEELPENGILPALKLSYDNLLPHMKRCFAYSCLFPKGYEMRKDLLIDLWIANGFISPRGQTDLYVIGDEIFYCLVSRSFLEDVQQHLVFSEVVCKMHDLMHDLGRCLMRHDYSFIEPGKDLITPNEVEILHLSLSSPDFSFSNLKMLRSLRSLFILVDGYEGKMISQLSKKHMYLRVLCLVELEASTLPKSICKLKYLRYLSIAFSTIRVLPESIIYLQNLQVLNLRGCVELRKLPEGMRHMKNLRCLDNQDCLKLDCMPIGMKELGCLRRLGVFVVGKKKGSQIRELGHLNLLGGELTLEGLQNVGSLEEAKSTNLKEKTNLISLVLSWRIDEESEEKVDNEDVLEGLEPSSSIKELSIEQYTGKMISPSWMMKLANLVNIKFVGCKRCERISSLRKLPSLRVLELMNMDALKCLNDDEFPRVQQLQIFGCNQLVSLPNDLPHLVRLYISYAKGLVSLPSKIPQLSELYITGCPQLRYLPDGLKEVTSLTIARCEILERRCEKEKGEDWPKISHIPRIRILGDDKYMWRRNEDEDEDED